MDKQKAKYIGADLTAHGVARVLREIRDELLATMEREGRPENTMQAWEWDRRYGRRLAALEEADKCFMSMPEGMVVVEGDPQDQSPKQFDMRHGEPGSIDAVRSKLDMLKGL